MELDQVPGIGDNDYKLGLISIIFSLKKCLNMLASSPVCSLGRSIAGRDQPRGVTNKSLVYSSEKSILNLIYFITGTVPIPFSSD